MNGAHAAHYVERTRGDHGALVRFQEENARLRAQVAELAGRLEAAEHRADRAEAELELVVAGVAA